MTRRTRPQQDPWDEALADLLATDAAGQPSSPRPDLTDRPSRGPDVVDGWLFGRDPATLPPHLPMRTTLVLAAAWFVLLPVVVSSSAAGDRPTWAWVLLGAGVMGVLTVMAALVGRWRSTPVWSALTSAALLVSGLTAAAPIPSLAATVVLLLLSGWVFVHSHRR